MHKVVRLVLNVHLYRPFPAENFLEKLPKTVTKIAVLDRTKEPGSGGEPLYLDVKSVLYDQASDDVRLVGVMGLVRKIRRQAKWLLFLMNW